ncbi:calcium/calmodulin-dependent protein kinase type 1D-like [Histomonas meleagridis]|uniref:calcium/calmodulin-dependent protein kinase type 1D-like n=1 Tax=Histomonas meleagridis TaxID=135588 RepID=UPI00355A2F4D|nr:calcium/calmodulin-dependent protein kinase type 1D-like [Histomonas meleagridis]KAH0805485.1 calcium/calmodulin-dependent protein kinase type 1D-like [Histomonas meleagridis]
MDLGDFLSLYQFEKQIGFGYCSRVFLATQVLTGQQVAIKIILKLEQNLTPIDKENFIRSSIDSPHLAQVYDVFEDADLIIIAMEYVSCGNLFRWIKMKGTLSESAVAMIIQHLLIGLSVLHDNDIIHRNIKPENILVSDTNLGATIKLSDFCLSNIIDNHMYYNQLSMIEECTAPEILAERSYTKAADMWGVGVVTFMLLSGNRPFNEDDQHDLLTKAIRGEYTLEADAWQHVSESAKDFVTNLLQPDPEKRMTVGEAIAHKWLKEELSNEPLEANESFLYLAMRRELKRTMDALKTSLMFKQFAKLTNE